MRLLYRPPYDWSALRAFLRCRTTPGVELAGNDFYQRTIECDGVAGFIDVRPDEENTCLVVRIALPKYEGLLRVVERVRRMFDLGADSLQIPSHLSRDPVLKPLLDRRPGLRLPGAWDPFEVAVRVVLGQRLTVVDSNGVVGDLVRRFGRPLRRNASLGKRRSYLTARRADFSPRGTSVPPGRSEAKACLSLMWRLKPALRPMTAVRVLLTIALVLAGILLLSDWPSLASQLHGYLSSLPLALAGVGYATLQLLRRPPLGTMLKRLLLAATFVLWAIDQLLPAGKVATFIGDVVIAAYILDLYWLEQVGKPPHRWIDRGDPL
jgi:hypothetical protein